MLLLLALIACGDDVTISGQVVAPDEPADGGNIATAVVRGDDPEARAVQDVPLPVGEAIVSDCYEQARNDFQIIRGARSGGAAPPPPPARRAPSKPRPRTRPQAEAAPSAPTPAPAIIKGTETRTIDVGGAGDMASAPAPADLKMKTPAPQPEPEPMAPPRQEAAEADREMLSQLGYVDDHDESAKPRSNLDWGATVHLSNDDSMSLASAQRTLFAVMNNRSLPASQIRPHELLNYFSFDAAPVPEDQLFSVLGAAEVTGETMTMSLAVKGALPPRQPLDLTVVIDRSGSMSSEGRMDYLKRGLRVMSQQLQRGDRVDVVLFDDAVCTPLRNYVEGRDDKSLLTTAIDRLSPRGGTDLDIGLREAYRLQAERDPSETHKRNRRVMLITDAMLNTGNVDEDLVSEVGKAFEDRGVRLTGVGVGRDFNDKMLDKLTEKGKGAYVYLGSEAVVDRVFGPGFRSLTETIAHDVRFALDLPDSLAMERFYGEEASTNPEDVQPINYYAGTTQLFLQDLRVAPGGAVRSDPVVLTVTYRDARTGEPHTQELRTTVGALLDGDPHNLRKGKALMAWTDLLVARAMGGGACDGPLRTYATAAARVEGDAELAFVSDLTGNVCRGADLSELAAPGVAYKVKVDSDIPIAEVALHCGGDTQTRSLSGGSTVARFEARPGSCRLVLQGNVPLTAQVDVPKTGGDVRCLVRGGRLSCS